MPRNITTDLLEAGLGQLPALGSITTSLMGAALGQRVQAMEEVQLRHKVLTPRQ